MYVKYFKYLPYIEWRMTAARQSGLLVQAIHAAADGDDLIATSVTVGLLARFAQSASCPEGAQL